MITRRQLATGGVLAAALGLGAASCGTGGDNAPDGPVELRMTVWTADEAHLALFQEIADEYVQEHADTVSGVTFESIPFEDYTTSLTTQLSGATRPTWPGSWRARDPSSSSPGPWSRSDRPWRPPTATPSTTSTRPP